MKWLVLLGIVIVFAAFACVVNYVAKVRNDD